MIPPIKGFIENTLIDWEGKIAATIFLPGCNFRCHYCHARHLVIEYSKLETVPFDVVIGFLKQNRGWIDGVVVSGGEPTLWDGLDEMLTALKDCTMQTKLDTNGSHPEVLDRLIRKRLADYVAMDLKAPLDERYKEVTAAEVNLEDIRASVHLLLEDRCDYEFRTTVCPKLLVKEDIVEMARAIRGARRYVLQSFRPLNCIDHEFTNLEPYPYDTMLELAEAARPWVSECCVRGHQEVQIST